jgi:excisionase family DNA binding protein
MSDPVRLHPDDLDAIVQSLADAVRGQSPWKTAAEAAEYIRAPLSRVRKLTMTREIPHEHDGRRPVYHRDELDRFIREGGAFTP